MAIEYNHILENFCVFKVNHSSARQMCEIYSKLTIKTPEMCQWLHFGVFNVNF